MFNLTKNETFKVLRKEIIPSYAYYKLSKVELYQILYSDLKIGDNLGFDIMHLPDRQWMEDVIYYKDAKHKIFSW